MAVSSGYIRRKKTEKQSDGNYKVISEWTSADAVEYQNGLTLEDSEVQISQENYDALTTEQKNSGAKYFIPDENSTKDNPMGKIMINDTNYSGCNIQINTWEDFD